MSKCGFCQKRFSNIGIHLKNEHYKCNVCQKWYLNQEVHLTIVCKLCLVPICNLYHHLIKEHYHCDLCNRWVKKPHTLVKCDKCNNEVCNINHHKSVFINCQDVKLIGTSIPILANDKVFVTVKCDNCKLGKRNGCNCYKHPIYNKKIKKIKT